MIVSGHHMIPALPNQKWDRRFLDQALAIAQWSKDQSTKVGCVIVGPNREIRSSGYNGFPRGVNDDVPERHVRPVKYKFFEHAERNAIYNAARVGTAIDGCTLYCGSTMQGPPCVDCARACIQSGIARVVCGGSSFPGDWREDWRESMLVSVDLFKEAGVIWETTQ